MMYTLKFINTTKDECLVLPVDPNEFTSSICKKNRLNKCQLTSLDPDLQRSRTRRTRRTRRREEDEEEDEEEIEQI